jgi:hypothetical protein
MFVLFSMLYSYTYSALRGIWFYLLRIASYFFLFFFTLSYKHLHGHVLRFFRTELRL